MRLRSSSSPPPRPAPLGTPLDVLRPSLQRCKKALAANVLTQSMAASGHIPSEAEWLQAWDAAYTHFGGQESAAQAAVAEHLQWRATSPFPGVADVDHVPVELVAQASSFAPLLL